jgi:hypothetical protein
MTLSIQRCAITNEQRGNKVDMDDEAVVRQQKKEGAKGNVAGVNKNM